METIHIDADNAKDFSPIIGGEPAEDTGRVFFRGIGVKDDDGSPLGALVYELKEDDEGGGRESRIHTVSYKNKKVFSLLEAEYKKAVKSEGITASVFSLRDKKAAERLEEAGFAVEERESDEFAFDVAYLRQLPIAKKVSLPSEIDSLSAMSLSEYRAAVQLSLLHGQKGLVGDIAYLPKYWFEEEVSCAAISGGKVQGLFLVRKTAENELHAVLYAVFDQKSNNLLRQLLLFTAQRIADTYPDDTRIVICREHTNVRKLTDKLIPDLKGETIYYGRREEKSK